MTRKFQIIVFFATAIFLLMTVLTAIAEARGGRRGGGRRGGFSRSSVARHGGFSSRAASMHRAPPSTRHSTTVQRTPPHSKPRPGSGADRQDDRQDDRQAYRDQAREDRQDSLDQRQEDRQDSLDQRQEDRQDFIEDELDDDWDDHWHDDGDVAGAFVVGVAVGAAAADSETTYVSTVTTLPCAAAEVVVEGVTYYQCGTTWYYRGYQGSNVVYLVTNPPPGY